MSTDLTMEEALRLHTFSPVVPGPITDPDKLRRLLDIAAVLLDSESPGDPTAVYTFDDIIVGVRELLAEGQTVVDADVRALLPGDSFVQVEGGYRWK